MSVVTNLILTFSSIEDEYMRIEEVNYFKSNGLQPINLVSADYLRKRDHLVGNNHQAWYGGSKFLEAPLYIGAFDHLDLEGFIEHLKEIEWEKPEFVQVIVKEEGDEKFRIIELTST